MPGDVAHAIFDAYVRSGRVSVERAAAWPAEVALVETYGDDPEKWIMCAVSQDWVPMPADVQDRLRGVVTYSEASSVLRRRWASFDV